MRSTVPCCWRVPPRRNRRRLEPCASSTANRPGWARRRARPRSCCGARRRAQHPIAELGGPPAGETAAARRDLRARQLGACRDLRQAPDRAASRHSGLGGRAEHRVDLSGQIGAARPVVPRRLAGRPQRGHHRDRRDGESRRRDHRRGRQRCRQPAGGRVRHRAADAGRAGIERRGEQVVHRLARHAAAPDRRLGAGRHDAAGHRSSSRAPRCRGRARLVGGARRSSRARTA